MSWNRMGFGMLLAAVAGAVFGHAWTASGAGWWWAGTLTLLCGALLILSSLYAREQRPRETSAAPLGQLLVKRGVITEGQLGEALARHHRDGRPVGRILVDMRLVTPVQLSHALGDQIPSPLGLPAYTAEPTVIATATPEEAGVKG
jgi:hypothetical protein